MNRQTQHEPFCFAGRPASCQGYFPNDILPCVCGAEGDVIAALSQVSVPAAACEAVALGAPELARTGAD